MPKHMILDQSGHDEKVWDKADSVGVEEARARFDDLMSRGYLAAVPGTGGAPGARIKDFDPGADVLFIPALQGG